jgi:hypothetical protein
MPQPLPLQLSWPQWHTISVLLATPSQWALQYFALSVGTQLQAAFAHFLGADIHVSFLDFRVPHWAAFVDGLMLVFIKRMEQFDRRAQKSAAPFRDAGQRCRREKR